MKGETTTALHAMCTHTDNHHCIQGVAEKAWLKIVENYPNQNHNMTGYIDYISNWSNSRIVNL